MSFIDAIKTCMSKYVTFSGRAGRAEYWWFFLFNFILAIIPIVGVIAALILFLPSLAVTSRRLHDIGKSFWWILTIPIVVGIPAGIATAMNSELLIGIVGLMYIVAVIVWIVWLASKGEDGPNRFGEDPRGGVSADVFA